MYAIHTTPGFIIGSRPSGEAGKLLLIFTQDLGLIRATAQGIRFEKSKLRPFIQDYSRGIYSFVKGKEFWRLTNAQEIESQVSRLHVQTDETQDAKLSGQNQELIARIALLLNRLLQGENPHPELFTVLDSLFIYLERSDFVKSDLTRSDLATLESLTVIRILHRLGYIGTVAHLQAEIISDDISRPLLDSLESKRTEMNIHINRALRESHL